VIDGARDGGDGDLGHPRNGMHIHAFWISWRSPLGFGDAISHGDNEECVYRILDSADCLTGYGRKNYFHLTV
jgi:hypothetical protein